MGLLGSIGKVIGGAGKSKSSSEPWKASQPYLKDVMSSAGELFEAGNLGGVRPFIGDLTREGIGDLRSLSRGNGVSGLAAEGFSGLLSAPRFGSETGYTSTLPTSQPGIQYGNVSGPQSTGYGTIAQPSSPQFRASAGPSAIGVGGVQGPQSIGVGGVQGPGSFDVSSRLPDGPNSYGRIDPNAGIDAVRQNVLETTLPQVASMFGTGGFSKSTMAQSAAGRAVASALAPYEYDQINRNRALDMQQFNTEQDRSLDYGLASTGLEANQFNIDENRRLGFDVGERNTQLNQDNVNDARRLSFDVNERDTALGQANADMDRRLGFDTSQAAARLAQDNTNVDRNNAFNFGLRDRQVSQDNLNDQERVAFNTQQHAAKLAQLNANRDVRNTMALAGDDRARAQYNTEQDRAFDQFFNQNQQQLSALGLAPAISGMQYGDAQSLFGLGQFQDQRKANRQEYDLNNVRAARDFFLPFGQLGTSATNTASPLDTIGKIGQAGAGIFSAFCDRRLKRDITRVGTWRGVAVYTFRYLWDDVLRIGPMAQEVPDHARFKVGKFYAVDLGAI